MQAGFHDINEEVLKRVHGRWKLVLRLILNGKERNDLVEQHCWLKKDPKTDLSTVPADSDDEDEVIEMSDLIDDVVTADGVAVNVMLNEEVDSEKRMEQKNNHSIILMTKYDFMCGADFVIVWQTRFIAGIFLYCTAFKTVVRIFFC